MATRGETMVNQEFYFFSKSERCQFMKNELKIYMPKYLQKDTTSSDGRDYYIILDWNFTTDISVYESIFTEYKIPYVKTLQDLPQDAGIYVGLYGADPLVLQSVKDKKIPTIEHTCPWVKHIEREIYSVPPTHQLVFMVDEYHVVLKNFFSILPSDTVIINDENYHEQLQLKKNDKPVYFITYSTFRERDCQKVIEYIKKKFPGNDHFFSLKGLCQWSKRQGLFSEIETKKAELQLDEIWIICNSKYNRSVLSLIKTVTEVKAVPLIISDANDIPENIPSDRNIGIVIAPIPFHKEKSIINRIIEIHPTRTNKKAK